MNLTMIIGYNISIEYRRRRVDPLLFDTYTAEREAIISFGKPI